MTWGSWLGTVVSVAAFVALGASSLRMFVRLRDAVPGREARRIANRWALTWGSVLGLSQLLGEVAVSLPRVESRPPGGYLHAAGFGLLNFTLSMLFALALAHLARVSWARHKEREGSHG